uniref:GH27987p n=1 Tax=Drosophila melanogaster TaxID=7227 RepID=Q8MSG9_DROME|nr:GH27987p [Drosophila melanogaster]
MFESVFFVLRQFYNFVCPMQIFYEIEDAEQVGRQEEWDIWKEL